MGRSCCHLVVDTTSLWCIINSYATNPMTTNQVITLVTALQAYEESGEITEQEYEQTLAALEALAAAN